MSFRNLLAQNLASHEVSSLKDELHLVQDEFNFFLDFKTTVGLDLNLLNDFGSFFGFTIFFEVDAKFHGGLGVFSFEEHLAVTCFSQRFKHLVSLLSAWQLIKQSGLAQGEHFNSWFLRLPTSFT